MTPRDSALQLASEHGAPFLAGSLWEELLSEARAAIAALPEGATSGDCAGAVMAYLARPRAWEPPHGLRRRLCEGLAARIRNCAAGDLSPEMRGLIT